MYNRRYADVTVDERLKVDPHEDPQVEFVDKFLAQLELDREHHMMAPTSNATTPGFITLSKNCSVTQLAGLFGCDASEYLELLHPTGSGIPISATLLRLSRRVRTYRYHS